jgi:hypothetical protein
VNLVSTSRPLYRYYVNGELVAFPLDCGELHSQPFPNLSKEKAQTCLSTSSHPSSSPAQPPLTPSKPSPSPPPQPASSPLTDAILAAQQAAAAQAAGTTDAPTQAAEAPVEAAKAPQSPREKLEAQIAKLTAKIAKDQEQLANLTTKLESIDTFAALAVGAAVEIKIGRAETTRNVIGRVLAEDGGRYKVFHGEGMEADITVVQANQILRVIPE